MMTRWDLWPARRLSDNQGPSDDSLMIIRAIYPRWGTFEIHQPSCDAHVVPLSFNYLQPFEVVSFFRMPPQTGAATATAGANGQGQEESGLGVRFLY